MFEKDKAQVNQKNNTIQKKKLQEQQQANLAYSNIMQLQSIIGNRAVINLLNQQKSETVQLKEENKTGLPDNLKTGVENISGLSFNDVRVHYNSDKPAEVGALAYTQGTDIYVASGQEEHLPHEAWHVAQQKQGRVKATMQMKDLSVNDDISLEKEADINGTKALQFVSMQDCGEKFLESDNKSTIIQNKSLPIQRKVLISGRTVEPFILSKALGSQRDMSSIDVDNVLKKALTENDHELSDIVTDKEILMKMQKLINTQWTNAEKAMTTKVAAEAAGEALAMALFKAEVEATVEAARKALATAEAEAAKARKVAGLTEDNKKPSKNWGQNANPNPDEDKTENVFELDKITRNAFMAHTSPHLAATVIGKKAYFAGTKGGRNKMNLNDAANMKGRLLSETRAINPSVNAIKIENASQGGNNDAPKHGEMTLLEKIYKHYIAQEEAPPTRVNLSGNKKPCPCCYYAIEVFNKFIASDSNFQVDAGNKHDTCPTEWSFPDFFDKLHKDEVKKRLDANSKYKWEYQNGQSALKRIEQKPKDHSEQEPK